MKVVHILKHAESAFFMSLFFRRDWYKAIELAITEQTRYSNSMLLQGRAYICAALNIKNLVGIFEEVSTRIHGMENFKMKRLVTVKSGSSLQPLATFHIQAAPQYAELHLATGGCVLSCVFESR